MFQEIEIPIDDRQLYGHLSIPEETKAWIFFAHGSGSSRKSLRNNWVADKLNKDGFATLLFDLLTVEEDSIFENRFDVDLLSSRLTIATNWLLKTPYYHQEPIAYFGASTGAAAAIVSAAKRPALPLYAIVSRGGRPDLAREENLKKIQVPTLLIVGGHDGEVIQLNDYARKKIITAKLVLVPKATHLFEESGAMEEVVQLTTDWLNIYLPRNQDYSLQT
jgi:pimeloyl-ACP methyl ester carboxylesterase